MVPCCRCSRRGYVGIKCSGTSTAQSNRCERRPRPGVVCDADVLSVDCVLGQSVFRSRWAILGQVVLCVGRALCSCQSHLLYFMLSKLFLFAPFLIMLCLTLAFWSRTPLVSSQSFKSVCRACFTLRPIPPSWLRFQLTSFDVDVGAADLAGLVFGSAEVVVVVDVAVVGWGREGVQLQGAVGVDLADVGHVVDVIAGGQVPAQYDTGGAHCWTGQGHPHRAGVGYPLQGGIHKVQPGGAHILTVYCRSKETTQHHISGRGGGDRSTMSTC